MYTVVVRHHFINYINNVVLKEDKPESILRPFVMGWMVKTEFWGWKPWPALLVRSCSYSIFRKGKTKLISRGLVVLQLLQSVVTLSCLFKCHYHSISQILLCLFLRWTTKLTFRKIQSLYRRYSARKYWDRIWTQHLLQNPCSSPYSKMPLHILQLQEVGLNP